MEYELLQAIAESRNGDAECLHNIVELCELGRVADATVEAIRGSLSENIVKKLTQDLDSRGSLATI
jgi:hypothetical protein